MARRLAFLLLALASLPAGLARADGAAPTSDASDVGTFAEDLARLDSPFLEERSRAQAALAGRLPSGRAELLAAFRREKGARKAALAAALGADDAPETLDALLDAYESADDLAVTRTLTYVLVSDADRVERAVASRPDGRGDPAKREALRGLLRRAKVERLFLGKKSRSGGTGYYHGQFDDLRVDREFALGVLLAILRDRPADRAGRVPETFPTGSYRWLVEPGFLLDRREVRGLAANAISDLVTPADEASLAGLEDAYLQLDAEIRDARRRNGQLRNPRQLNLVAMSERAVQDVILVTLAKSGVPGWMEAFENRVGPRRGRGVSSLDLDDIAALNLRMGRFQEALDYYQMARDRLGGALIPYNMACAHAMWARELRATKNPRDVRAADRHRSDAIRLLRECVESGYEDWPWMEQDRDLDDVRDTSEYRALLEKLKIKASFNVPGDRPTDPAPAMGSAPGTPPSPAMDSTRRESPPPPMDR